MRFEDRYSEHVQNKNSANKTRFRILKYFVIGLAILAVMATENQTSDVNNVKPPDRSTEKVNTDKRDKFIQQLHLQTKLDDLDEKLSESSAPHFCEILCDESEFKREPSEHPVEALLRDYEQEGARSFDDPKFRMIFESTFPVCRLFSRSTRELLFEIDQFQSRQGAITASETFMFAARFQIELIRYIWSIKAELPRLQQRNDEMKKVRALQNECNHAPAAELHQRCLEIDPKF